MSPEIPADDLERARTSMVHVAEHLELEGLLERCRAPVEVRMTPAAFYHRLVQAAARAHARIVLPEVFTCVPDQVVVYGDCAVNPDPDAQMLADIAIQSADSAARFGIEPRLAMLSYSTGDSGTGVDVGKVREATRLARARRPELLLDGPIQYDAAENSEVAKAKAPNSPVAGRASVFIFPDLNTGNTTYKAVQRSANVVSVGPMLQGLNKPVNDFSRGALVEDIVYTIALTVIQASD
jgi:phosphate acetyltransferase